MPTKCPRKSTGSGRLNYFNTSRKGHHTAIEKMLRAGSNVAQIARALELDERFVQAVADAVKRRPGL